ncbi:MAG: Ada metal-binding domain-containing protein [Fibrobacterota bacterium]
MNPSKAPTMTRTLSAFVLCLMLPAMTIAQTVVYNHNTRIYHAPSCKWAHRCTRNCTDVTLKEAKASGGRPCKICGGR